MVIIIGRGVELGSALVPEVAWLRISSTNVRDSIDCIGIMPVADIGCIECCDDEVEVMESCAKTHCQLNNDSSASRRIAFIRLNPVAEPETERCGFAAETRLTIERTERRPLNAQHAGCAMRFRLAGLQQED
jgi:hypothetical protein